ncbi:MAG: OmpA family protein [Propioniciclava sp.]|jgi:outer membrane protein OmpA-like peptidoglycan-associated protein
MSGIARKSTALFATIGLVAALVPGTAWVAGGIRSSVQGEATNRLASASISAYVEVVGRDVTLSGADEATLERARATLDGVPGLGSVTLVPQPVSSPTATPTPSTATARPTATPTPTPTPSGPLPTVNAIMFPGSSARLPASAVAEVDALAQILRSRPDARVTLTGHTDSGRTQSVRVMLGQERADAVAQALEQRGIAASRITTTSQADRQPVASNASAEGRAQNRRVSVTLSSDNG